MLWFRVIAQVDSWRKIKKKDILNIESTNSTFVPQTSEKTKPPYLNSDQY